MGEILLVSKHQQKILIMIYQWPPITTWADRTESASLCLLPDWLNEDPLSEGLVFRVFFAMYVTMIQKDLLCKLKRFTVMINSYGDFK